MKELYKRILADTPLFFKKLRNKAVVLGVVAASILATGYIDDEGIARILRYIVAVNAAIAAVSQTTKTDTNDGKS